MLAILTTHPIQYQVPLWQMLARDGRIPFEVWYLTEHATRPSTDHEFGKTFAWDIEMLSGYPHRFLETPTEATPGSFWKCRITEPLGDLLQAQKVKALWIQGWQVFAYWQAVWAAKKTGVEVWLRGESNDLAPSPAWKRPIKRLMLAQFLRRVDRFLCIGTANRRLYQSFGVPADRLYSAPYAVDNERFAAQAEAVRGSRFAIRESWRIPRDAFCVLFCGKFIPKKRPMDLVRAAQVLCSSAQLQASGCPPRVHLLFVGSGQIGSELRERCNVVYDAEGNKRSGVSGQFSGAAGAKPAASFTGFLNQTEISKAYIAADCLVLPSDYAETWGLVVNEAMASGLPCIISDRCGCAEDLRQYSSNVVYSCGNTTALTEALRQVQRHLTRGVNSLPDLSETASIVSGLFTLAA